MRSPVASRGFFLYDGLYGRSRCNWRDDPPAARPTQAMRRTTRRDREGYALRRPRAAAQASNEGARLEADAMANPARRLGAIPSRHALTSPRLTGGVWGPNTTQKEPQWWRGSKFGGLPCVRAPLDNDATDNAIP